MLFQDQPHITARNCLMLWKLPTFGFLISQRGCDLSRRPCTIVSWPVSPEVCNTQIESCK